VPADEARTAAMGVVGLVFVVAFAVLIGAQLALMSFLDEARAEEAARSVAESQFAAALVEQAVRDAAVPLAGEQVGTEIARQASTNPRVAEALRRGLVDAHRAIVEPDALDLIDSADVESVLDSAIDAAETEVGVNLDGLRQQLDVPQIGPRYLPDAGAGPIVETVRTVAALVTLAAAAIVLIVHPRRGRALAGLGIRAAVVCGAWAVVLLVVGWALGRVADTLFGQLVDQLWREAAPYMLLLLGAGVVLGAGLGFGGMSIDGLTRDSDVNRW